MSEQSDGTPRSFGVEEEYLLLDAESGCPVDRAADIVAALQPGSGAVQREFFMSQLETATPVCRLAEDAGASLTEFRAAAAQAAAPHGVIVAGSGLPPVGGDTEGTVTQQERYLAIERQVRRVGAYQYVTGTHVHVAVPSREAGLDAIAALSRWAPALLALTANSPRWCGADTGFASWRHVMGLSWPVSGWPPRFEDVEEYEQTVQSLVASGIVLDPGVLSWSARLSERFPTVELRIADAQLRAEDAVDFAVLVRALVDDAITVGEERLPGLPGVLGGALWSAARDGLSDALVDPVLGTSFPSPVFLEMMLDRAGAALDRAGDRERAERYLARRLVVGSPAEEQRQAYEAGGSAALLALLRAGTAGAENAD